MQTLIVINNVAARTRRAWPAIHQQLSNAAIAFDVYETKGPGDATKEIRDALNAGVTTVAVVGGDGTLSEAAEGFFQFAENVAALPRPINPNATLAILPAGTGDDFARGIRGKRVSLKHWVDTLITHCRAGDKAAPITIDVLYGLCDGYQKPFICLNASTMGIGGETAGRVAAQGNFIRSFSGEFRFVLAAVGALAAWRERRVRVTLDGRTIADGPMNLAAVANALYAGGGMMLSPQARFDDGQLDVVTASGLSRAQIIRELTRIHSGGHIKNARINVAQGEIVRIETFLEQDAMQLEADGNVRGFTPVQFRVLPHSLKFVV